MINIDNEKKKERYDAACILSNMENIEKALQLAIDVLINPIEYLSQEELRDAYQIQQYNYDILDIRNELDIGSEYYIDKFNIDKYPVSEKEINDMASELRSILDCNADACWTTAKQESVEIVLAKRQINSI